MSKNLSSSEFGLEITDSKIRNHHSAIRNQMVENKGVEPLTLPTKVGMLWPICQVPFLKNVCNLIVLLNPGKYRDPAYDGGE